MADPTCERCAEQLGDYVDERLSPEDRSAMRRHFLSCNRCRALLDSYCTLPGMVRDATDVPMPRELRARLRWVLRRNKDR